MAGSFFAMSQGIGSIPPTSTNRKNDGAARRRLHFRSRAHYPGAHIAMPNGPSPSGSQPFATIWSRTVMLVV